MTPQDKLKEALEDMPKWSGGHRDGAFVYMKKHEETIQQCLEIVDALVQEDELVPPIVPPYWQESIEPFTPDYEGAVKALTDWCANADGMTFCTGTARVYETIRRSLLARTTPADALVKRFREGRDDY